MPADLGPAMTAEFDTVAEWTAEVAAGLGPGYYLPAACRGSGHPAALDWLLRAPAARPGAAVPRPRRGGARVVGAPVAPGRRPPPAPPHRDHRNGLVPGRAVHRAGPGRPAG